MQTIYRCIASKRGLPVKASLYPCPRWLIGWVNAVMPCNPWSMPYVKRYYKSMSCMRMKPPSRSCVQTKTEKHTGPTSGPMLQRFMKGSMLSFITEIACMAHARRKFYELHVANKSEIAAQALASFKALYAIEAEAKDLTAKEREQRRQEKARPILEKLHDWMLAQRTLVPDGWGTAKALDYSLKRWAALTRYLEDGCVPIDNNHIEQQIRSLALGRKNWLFAGSLRAGQRAAAVMTLIQSAKLNGHDPLAYLGDILQRLPTQPNNQIHELLPHHWRPAEQ